MNRHERWILEAARALRQPIRALTSDGVEEWFNRHHHRLDPAGVANVLRHLLLEDLIVLLPGEGGTLLDDQEELRRLVELRYREPLFKTTFYGLTAAGGAAWEEVSQPDWARYIDSSFGIEPNAGEVICADPARAERYVFSPYQEHPPLPHSVRRDRLEPWRATYWKTLPTGYRISFLYDSGRPVRPE
jgi:hypothetical protein